MTMADIYLGNCTVLTCSCATSTLLQEFTRIGIISRMMTCKTTGIKNMALTKDTLVTILPRMVDDAMSRVMSTLPIKLHQHTKLAARYLY